MENMVEWLEANKGNIIILFDNDGRRYEGIIERVFADFFQIFETRQKLNKTFKFSSIKDFTIKGEKNGKGI